VPSPIWLPLCRFAVATKSKIPLLPHRARPSFSSPLPSPPRSRPNTIARHSDGSAMAWSWLTLSPRPVRVAVATPEDGRAAVYLTVLPAGNGSPPSHRPMYGCHILSRVLAGEVEQVCKPGACLRRIFLVAETSMGHASRMGNPCSRRAFKNNGNESTRTSILECERRTVGCRRAAVGFELKDKTRKLAHCPPRHTS